MKITIIHEGTQIEKVPPFNEVPVKLELEATVEVGLGIRFQRTEVRTMALGKVLAIHDGEQQAVQVATETGVEWVPVAQIREVLTPDAYGSTLTQHTIDLSQQIQKDAEKAGVVPETIHV